MFVPWLSTSPQVPAMKARPDALFAACATISLSLLAGCGPKDQPATGQQQQPPPPTVEVKSATATERKSGAKKVTRDEFKKLVLGKKTEDVIAGVGKPTSTMENGGEVSWYYHDFTTDPLTGKTDVITQVIFENGVVVRINF